MTNTLAPIPEPFSDDIARVLSNYPRIDGYLLMLFRTFANSKRFLEKGVPNLLDKASPLDLRTREIVILRVTARNRCEYEWGVHVSAFGAATGLSAAQIDDTASNPVDSELWSAEELKLIHAIDELCTSGNLDDPTLQQFQNRWTAEQQLEIFSLCGAYSTISFVANAARLPCEDFAAHFPQAAIR